jgi:hypothetical protein
VRHVRDDALRLISRRPGRGCGCRTQLHVAPRTRQAAPRACVSCGNTFQVRRGPQKACSPACVEAYRADYYKARFASYSSDPEYRARRAATNSVAGRKRRSRPDFAEKRREYERARRANNIQARIAAVMRGRIRDAVRAANAGRCAPGSAVRDLGCTIDAFREHIAAKFVSGMSWANWGRGPDRWHLDHIRPLSSFNLTDPASFREAVHFTNYQPLWSGDNLRKNASLEWCVDKRTATCAQAA